MGHAEIDLRILKAAVDAVLDHVIEDLQVERVQIDDADDYYWEYAFTVRPVEGGRALPEAGRLSDDMDFVKLIRRDEAGAASYNLVHIAPLLRFIGEKIKE